jgi:folate-binding protein YgfZ
LELQRVALGVPAWAVDFDENSTPLEAGLDAQIAFGKGCYVGQEVIAMATYRGRVPWNLVRLEVEGMAPPVGSALDTARGGKGKVTSAAPLGERALLLGLVHREKIEPDSTVLLADGRTATVLGLPFGSRPGAGTRG